VKIVPIYTYIIRKGAHINFAIGGISHRHATAFCAIEYLQPYSYSADIEEGIKMRKEGPLNFCSFFKSITVIPLLQIC